MVTSGFVGRWIPVTAGERLAHFLAENVDSLRTLELRTLRDLSGVPRGPSFGDFLQGCLVLHAFGRLIQVAKHLRGVYLDDPNEAVRKVEAFASEMLDISRGSCRDFERLAVLALEAAERSGQASATPSQAEKRAVLARCRSLFRCYSCDGILDPSAPESLDSMGENGKRIPNKEYLTYDHLWPHSLGGDSIEANLLPACQFCNRVKQHTASWELALIQAVLPEVVLGATELDLKHIAREAKVALHMRAALAYARKHGTSLKDAYLAIGPRSAKILIVDPGDTPDFFNLCGHDVTRAGVLWE